jgi:hypothetical protein
MASGAMIHVITSVMTTGSDVQAMLKFCLDKLRGCGMGTTDDRFMKYVVEMGSGGMIYVTSLMTTSSGIQIFSILLQQFETLQYWYY